MKYLLIKILIFCTTIILLSSCSSSLFHMSKINKDKSSRDIKFSDKEVFVSKTETSKILIPRPKENKIWGSSNSNQVNLPENIALTPNIIESNVRKTKVKFSNNYINSKIYPGAVIAEGKIFVISEDGILQSFDALNIKKKYWEFDLSKYKSNSSYDLGGMVYNNLGVLFITNGGQEVFAINIKDGTLLWKKQMNNIIRSAPEVGDGRLYVIAIDDSVYALDMLKGSIIWQHSENLDNTSVYGNASPVYKDDILFVPYSSGELYALRPFDGKEIWHKSFSKSFQDSDTYVLGDIKAAPVIVNDILLTLSLDGFLTASNIKSGALIWEHEISGYNNPWYAGDFVYFISQANKLLAINVYTGEIHWSKDMLEYNSSIKDSNKEIHSKEGFFTGPVLAGSLLRVVSSKGKVFSISPIDGKLRSVLDIEYNIYLPPLVAYNRIYLVSGNSELISLYGENTLK